jgi:hypothetical protein
VIHLEAIGLAEAIDSLGAVEPRSMSSQAALELARAELDALAAQPQEPLLAAPRLGIAPASPHTMPPTDCATGELVRKGGIWTLTWHGRRTHLPDLKGVNDLAVLLRQPSTDVHVLDLYAAVGGERRSKAARHEVGGEEVGLGDAVDARARAAYQQRIRDLHEDVETAQALGDSAREERSRDELDALVSHLAAAYGLGGRPRQVGDPVERARSAVAWRIRSAIRRITTADPALGRHLSASVRTGTWCRYEPPEPAEWTVTI